MYVISVGGMRLRHWSKYFGVIVQTFKALRAAKAAPGCVHADIFQKDRVFFAISVWQSTADMKAYASTGIHRQMMKTAPDTMATTFNHSFQSDVIPSRVELRALWLEADAAGSD